MSQQPLPSSAQQAPRILPRRAGWVLGGMLVLLAWLAAAGLDRLTPSAVDAPAAAAPSVQAAPPSAAARTSPARPAPAPGAAQTASIAWADLPERARQIHVLIQQGGPFAYERDGTVFFNRERLLPTQPRGYYREYTVARPGAASRGARRIVCGGPPRQPDACWYSPDHYQSFLRIRPPP